VGGKNLCAAETTLDGNDDKETRKRTRRSTRGRIEPIAKKHQRSEECSGFIESIDVRTRREMGFRVDGVWRGRINGWGVGSAADEEPSILRQARR